MCGSEELRAQLLEAFGDAKYPVTGPEDLFEALPEGLETTFESDEVTLTLPDLNEHVGDTLDFPYTTVDEFVADILEGLGTSGVLDTRRE